MSKINISIIGLGKMGTLVLQVCKEMGVNVFSSIDPYNKDADFTQITATALQGVDVCICFTQPQVALENIQKIAKFKKRIVMATTGWEQDFEKAREIIEQNNTAMIYASNFSIGVNIFFEIISQAAKIMDKFDDYDIFGWEMHHNRKLDSPSGTAKTITNILLENIERKTKNCYEKLDRKIKPQELHFASIRTGDVAGTHCVGFDSDFDNITLQHTAKNRTGFAKGAIIAARWIMEQKTGLYSEKDLMGYLLQK